MKTIARFSLVAASAGSLGALAGCGSDGGSTAGPPVLAPEPPGAPSAIADGRLGCLGRNAPAPPSGSALVLTAWIRTLEDPANAGGVQPAAEVEALDETGISLAKAFADGSSGRTAITVPVRPTGFVGTVTVSAAGYLPVRFTSSRPITDTTVSGWAWMTSPAKLAKVAGDLGQTIQAGTGVLVGAVHDCDVFGVGQSVLRVGETAGVIYVEDFAPVSGRTYTAPSGRFAVLNVAPGPVVVEAFGRTSAGGKLELLGRGEGLIVPDTITAVEIEPRMGVDR